MGDNSVTEEKPPEREIEGNYGRLLFSCRSRHFCFGSRMDGTWPSPGLSVIEGCEVNLLEVRLVSFWPEPAKTLVTTSSTFSRASNFEVLGYRLKILQCCSGTWFLVDEEGLGGSI